MGARQRRSDAALSGCHEIHVVRAGRGERDQPQRRAGFDDLASDAQLVDEHDVTSRNLRGDVLAGRVIPDLEIRQHPLQRARVEVAVNADGCVIEEYRSHGGMIREASNE